MSKVFVVVALLAAVVRSIAGAIKVRHELIPDELGLPRDSHCQFAYRLYDCIRIDAIACEQLLGFARVR